MNREDEIVELLNAVLGMSNGEVRFVRERHTGHCIIHRYREGWYVFATVSDCYARSHAALGWHFNHVEDIAEFITGAIGDRHINFILLGTDS